MGAGNRICCGKMSTFAGRMAEGLPRQLICRTIRAHPHTQGNSLGKVITVPPTSTRVVVRYMSATSRLKKYKTKKHGKSLKTRQAVAKRFLVTGKGNLKRSQQGKRHNTSFKSMVRLRRLNKVSHMDPTSRITKNKQKMIIR